MVYEVCYSKESVTPRSDMRGSTALTSQAYRTYNLLSIVANAGVQLQNVVADEPDEVGEVGRGRLVLDELEHGRVLHSVDVESERAHCDAHHALAVLEELDGFRVQGEVVRVL